MPVKGDSSYSTMSLDMSNMDCVKTDIKIFTLFANIFCGMDCSALLCLVV